MPLLSWRRLTLRCVHRIHAVLMSVLVIAAAGSGLLHTVMSRTQAPPPRPLPSAPLPLERVAIAPGQLPALLPATAGAIVSVQLRAIGGAPWWQVLTSAQRAPFWIDAQHGAFDAEADRRAAAEIASRFLGGASVAAQSYLTEFDSEYSAIFRILPVHRFGLAAHADDGRGTRVYVSTLTGSVTRHTDDARQVEAAIFSNLHKWQFIPHRGWRDGLIIAAMTSLILLALGGLVLFATTRRQAPAATPRT